jgi:outer membrane receptor protein involved in Fe transport
LSPRLGLSFPVSTKGAIRLSYGHFFQMPSLEKLYQNPVLENYTQFSIMNSNIGNPNLDAEKTVQYEAGLQQELVPGLGLELSVFYKDIRDLLGVEILTLSNGTTFYRYVNKEYGNATGVTLAFNQATRDGTLSSRLDYTYMSAKGTSSSAEAIQEVAITAGPGAGAYTMASRKVDFLNWDQTHSLNAVVNYIPASGWLISVIGQWGSGLPYTPATLDPSVEIPGTWWANADRKPIRWSVDLKFGKSFKVWDTKLLLYLDIYNVFDHANENYVNAITGRAGPNAYLPELGRIRYERIDKIGEFTRQEADYNPSQYSKPRLIQFGVNWSF